MMWYEVTPTIWSHDGFVDYINVAYEDVEKKFKDKETKEKNKLKEWVDKAKKDKTHVTTASRGYAVSALARVPSAAVTAAKLKAETTTVEKDEDKELLIEVKEYEKVAALAAQYAEKVKDG